MRSRLATRWADGWAAEHPIVFGDKKPRRRKRRLKSSVWFDGGIKRGIIVDFIGQFYKRIRPGNCSFSPPPTLTTLSMPRSRFRRFPAGRLSLNRKVVNRDFGICCRARCGQWMFVSGGRRPVGFLNVDLILIIDSWFLCVYMYVFITFMFVTVDIINLWLELKA